MISSCCSGTYALDLHIILQFLGFFQMCVLFVACLCALNVYSVCNANVLVVSEIKAAYSLTCPVGLRAYGLRP